MSLAESIKDHPVRAFGTVVVIGVAAYLGSQFLEREVSNNQPITPNPTDAPGGWVRCRDYTYLSKYANSRGNPSQSRWMVSKWMVLRNYQ